MLHILLSQHMHHQDLKITFIEVIQRHLSHLNLLFLYIMLFQNKLGDTALHAGAWKGHAEAVKMLLHKGKYCTKICTRGNYQKRHVDLNILS